jgi:protein-S-isoprenylcysteine O-methyltransferase Ste14
MAGLEKIGPVNQKRRLLAIQVGAVCLAALILLSASAWEEETGTLEIVEDTIEVLGVFLLLFCIFGRLWSILYIGGRKNAELVTVGPYSITRNPLYFFSAIGAIGIGLMFGSLVLAATSGAFIYSILMTTALKEAAFLRTAFGQDYDEYASRTPLLWPNPSRYRDHSNGNFSQRALKRTFLDGLYFLAIFPAVELVEYLHDAAILPILLKLY